MTREEYEQKIKECYNYSCADLNVPEKLHEELMKEVYRIEQGTTQQVLPQGH